MWEELKEGASTKGQIGELAKEKNVDFLVIGYEGIKGPKAYAFKQNNT